MIRESEELPRWLQRREGRKSGRYDGNKVVRWIARGNPKEREAEAEASAEAQTGPEWPRLGGFGRLRLVADNQAV